jgi:hypothetical protein
MFTSKVQDTVIRLKRIYNFDTPCLFIHHFLCVLLHFVTFYVFFGTNLLTRCHSASSLFFVVFMFQKSYTGNILGIGRNKSWSSYFPDTRQSPKQRRGGPGASHTMGWCSQPLARATRWWGHLAHLLAPPFRLYILLGEENLNTQSIFHETYCKPPLSSMRDREGLEALPGTLPERGITTGGLLPHHACLQSDMWVVYLGLRVHSSS